MGRRAGCWWAEQRAVFLPGTPPGDRLALTACGARARKILAGLWSLWPFSILCLVVSVKTEQHMALRLVSYSHFTLGVRRLPAILPKCCTL